MNIEELKKSLIDMINEANYLEDNELVDIPQIDVKVKKGRREEFLNAAKLYYEMSNQVILTKEDALEHIKQVYESLSKELEEINESKISENKEAFEKLEYLKKDLERNANMQLKYQKIENSLKIKAAVEPGSWENIRDTQDLLKELKDTEQKIRNSMAEIKNKINDEVKKVIEIEMGRLREKYAKKKTRNYTSGLDGTYILNEDKEAYDNLYLLLRVIENASEVLPLVNIDNILCVNPHQEATARLLLPQIKQLKNKKIKKMEKPQLLDLNIELKEQIALELTELIKNAKNHPNEALAEGKEVLVSDLEKYNLLANQFEILTMIYDTDKLITIGKAQVPENKENEYKDICNKLEELAKKDTIQVNNKEDIEMDLKQNEVIIEEFRKEINDIVTNGGLTKEKLERFNLLARQIEILNSVDRDVLLSKVDGAIINEDLAQEYIDNLNKINDLRSKKEIDPLEVNKPLIKAVEEQINRLASDIEVKEENIEKYNLLNQKLAILKEVKPADSLVSIDGVNVSILKMDEYINISQKLNDLEKNVTSTISSDKTKLLDQPKESLKRKAVKMVRKATKKEWWKKNKKKVIGIGLSLMVVAFTLSTLSPTIIYFNSCLAMSNPELAGLLGPINNFVATIGRVTMSSINFNVASSNLLKALGSSALKLGLIGSGAIASYKIFKQTDENHLQDFNEKQSTLVKIKEIGNKIIRKTKELTENLAYAVNGHNITSNQYLNNQIGKEIKLDNEAQNVKKPEANVEDSMEEEASLESEAEISRRYEQIQRDMNEAKSPITIPENHEDEEQKKELVPDIGDLTSKAFPSQTVVLSDDVFQQPIMIPDEEELMHLLAEGLIVDEEEIERGRA